MDYNDIIMKTYVSALKSQGYDKQAEKCEDIYEIQKIEKSIKERSK